MALALVPKRRTISPTGVDVGRTSMRAVQLSRSEGRWRVATALACPLSGDSGDQARLRAAAQRLRRALRQQEFRGSAVVVGLSQPDVELQALELDRALENADDGSAARAAKEELERLSRYEGQALETDHWWLPEARATRTSAVGAAVPRPVVEPLWNLCRDAGADCRRVDVMACALTRAGALLRPPATDEVWGVLDLGARSSRLAVCVDHAPVLVRSIETGGSVWTERVAETLQVSPAAAERHKCDHGIRPAAIRDPGSTGSRAQSESQAGIAELAGMIFAAIRPELDRIATEVERSFEYVLQCYPNRRAAELILAGGGAALKRLDSYMAARLGIPVHQAEHYLDQRESQLFWDSNLCRKRLPFAALLGAAGLAVPPEDRP